jgi:hypothetical protein
MSRTLPHTERKGRYDVPFETMIGKLRARIARDGKKETETEVNATYRRERDDVVRAFVEQHSERAMTIGDRVACTSALEAVGIIPANIPIRELLYD